MSEFNEEKITSLGEENYKWYILVTYNTQRAVAPIPNDEKRRAQKLQKLISAKHLEGFVKEIFVPIVEQKDFHTQEIIEINLAPGYIFINANLTPEVKELIRYSQIGLLMGGYEKPTEIPESTIQKNKDKIAKKAGEGSSFEIGQVVKIISGNFLDFSGVVTKVLDDKGCVEVSISIFGRYESIVFHITEIQKQ